jgi:hypothetical protein
MRKSQVKLSIVFDNIDRWKAERGEMLPSEISNMVQECDVELSNAADFDTEPHHHTGGIESDDEYAIHRTATDQHAASSAQVAQLQRQMHDMAQLLASTQKQLVQLQEQFAHMQGTL